MDNHKNEKIKQHEFSTAGIRFHILFFGLALGFFLAALDTTIIITALGIISSEFNSVDQIGWIGSAYLIALSGLQPIYFNLSDIIGQKYAYLISVSVFILGSIVCGVSNSMILLIIGRAIQGIGGAGLFTCVLTIICTLMDSRTRGAALGVASLSGPIIGGYLAEKGQWRWCFFINIFFGVLILLITIVCCDLPLTEKQNERKTGEKTIWQQLRQVDYANFLLLMPGTICLLCGIQIGGENLDFKSTQVIVLITVGIVLMVTFVLTEIWIVKHPLFTRSFISSPSNVGVLVGQFMIGMSYNTLIYFIPLHFQIVQGNDAIHSALELFSFIAAGVVGGLISGIFTKSTGHYLYLIWIGGVLCIVGSFLLQQIHFDTKNVLIYVYLAIYGFGNGICMNLVVIAGQATVPEEELIIATSHGQFTRLFGGSFGVSIGSVLFNNHIKSELNRLGQTIGLKSLEALGLLPARMLMAIRKICFDAFINIYLFIAITTVAMFISTLFIKQVNMNK